MFQKRRKSILDRAVSVSLAWWVFVCIAMADFAYTRPRIPVPIEGRVYAFHIWGIVVYLTRGEYLIVGLSPYWFAVSLLLFGINYRRNLRS